jgi:hypothetical protein
VCLKSDLIAVVRLETPLNKSPKDENRQFEYTQRFHLHDINGKGVQVRTTKSRYMTGNTKNLVRYEVLTALTMKNGVFWDVVLCGSCKC